MFGDLKLEVVLHNRYSKKNLDVLQEQCRLKNGEVASLSQAKSDPINKHYDVVLAALQMIQVILQFVFFEFNHGIQNVYNPLDFHVWSSTLHQGFVEERTQNLIGHQWAFG